MRQVGRDRSADEQVFQGTDGEARRHEFLPAAYEVS
jgi:hypothetical protein